ncbi:hypothetical protein SARC_04355 [Sphaeroforma arctica JP610]|uniref:Uncharacterized protein n=1 Tax=Sphaeroforma arctica JP610 TaxID=667725 RepID=A0A0L0G3D9_9EUKA|nr:hypothetical protein SARC_04355 [Sphaeroforma arctica JP610]KNC83389.1 hypothetical protein SARC_04355 [Sphaeroforma arctica JP610]|eukprot:XP_014157291.1 hypothetical protein SARC_04355 [Sphaeroforma arctica JP610]
MDRCGLPRSCPVHTLDSAGVLAWLEIHCVNCCQTLLTNSPATMWFVDSRLKYCCTLRSECKPHLRAAMQEFYDLPEGLNEQTVLWEDVVGILPQPVDLADVPTFTTLFDKGARGYRSIGVTRRYNMRNILERYLQQYGDWEYARGATQVLHMQSVQPQQHVQYIRDKRTRKELFVLKILKVNSNPESATLDTDQLKKLTIAQRDALLVAEWLEIPLDHLFLKEFRERGTVSPRRSTDNAIAGWYG